MGNTVMVQVHYTAPKTRAEKPGFFFVSCIVYNCRSFAAGSPNMLSADFTALAIASAINALRGQIESDSPSQSSIAAAMAALTQAMAGIY